MVKRIKFNTSIFFLTAIAGIVFVFSPVVHSFDGPVTHNSLARMSVWVYNNKNSDVKLSEKQLGWIQKGAVDEDNPATRCVNHFYNPITQKPIVPGADTVLEWAHDSIKQTIPAMGGDFTWEQAKYAFIDGDEQKAFESLGHVLHLIEDMAVPAHVRGDHHLRGDSFEDWVRDNGKDVFDNNIASCSNLDGCMNDIANFTNKNFFSTDSIDGTDTKLDTTAVTFRILNGKEQRYLQNDYRGNSYLLIRAEKQYSQINYSLDDNVHADYWRILSPQAVSYGARVIEIFFEEVEKEKITIKPDSVWSKFTGFFKDIAGTVYMGKEVIENTVGSFFNATTNFVNNGLSSEFKNLLAHGEENQEILNELFPAEIELKDDIKKGDDFIFNGEIIGKSQNFSMYQNSISNLWVKIKNTGINKWDRNQVSLNITTEKINGRRADSPFFHPSWITRLRPVANNVVVKNGDIITLEFQVGAPANSGNHDLTLIPVYQNMDEFYKLGSNFVTWNINVQKQELAENKISQSVSLANLAPSETDPWTSALEALGRLISNMDQISANQNAQNTISNANDVSTVSRSLPFSPTVVFNVPSSDTGVNTNDDTDNTANLDADDEEDVDVEVEVEQEIIAELELPEPESEIEPEIILGCTDETANNYNLEATEDDGSCEFCIYGCVDPDAQNYNSAATCDDGSCIAHILGCADATALNFDETATQDDGSCIYSGPEPEAIPDPEPEMEDSEPEPEDSEPAVKYESLDVVINEIAWMGTNASTADEWMELYNNTDEDINLTGWILTAEDGTPKIELSGTINSHGYYLLERSDDFTTSEDADFIYTGALNNNSDGEKPYGEKLSLLDPVGNIIDEVNCLGGWFAGDNDTKQTMERKDSNVSGNDHDNWISNDTIHKNGNDASGNDILGTPRSANSSTYPAEPESEDNITYNQKVILIQGSNRSKIWRSYLKIKVYENKIYYAWGEGDGENLRKLAFGRSDINGDNFNYKIIGQNRGIQNLDFLIHNGKAYFGWVQSDGYSLHTIYNFYTAQADLSIIDDGLDENNYSEIQVTDDNNVLQSLVSLDFYNGTIRAMWSNYHIGNSNNKEISFVDFFPDSSLMMSNVQIIDSSLTSSGGEANFDTAVNDMGKQYLTWGHGNILQWGSMDFDDNTSWQDYKNDEYKSMGSKITITNGQVELVWIAKYDENKIYYSPIDVFSPRVLINDGTSKDLQTLQTFNNKVYLLYNENIPAENYGANRMAIVLREISNGVIENTISYTVDPDEEITLRDIIWVSDLGFTRNGNPIISWIEQDKRDGHFDILMMNIEF